MLSLLTCPPPLYVRPKPVPRMLIKPRALPSFDWNTISYLTGKGIIVFTMTYCTLNWMMYKQEREEREKDEDETK